MGAQAYVALPGPRPSLPTSVAGSYEAVMTLLEGFPVYAECACGCGLETYVGHEPVITKAQAARMLEGI